MDYMQLATLGLIEAIDRFDAEPRRAVQAFAAPRIRGAVLNALEALSETYQQNALRKRLQAERLESLRRARRRGRKADLFGALADVAVGFALGYMLEGSGMVAPTSSATATSRTSTAASSSAARRAARRGWWTRCPTRSGASSATTTTRGCEFKEIAALFGAHEGADLADPPPGAAAAARGSERLGRPEREPVKPPARPGALSSRAAAPRAGRDCPAIRHRQAAQTALAARGRETRAR